MVLDYLNEETPANYSPDSKFERTYFESDANIVLTKSALHEFDTMIILSKPVLVVWNQSGA